MNLADGDFLKPYILSHPKTRVALKNDNITLTCQAVSTEDSGTVFIWKRDNVVCLQLMVDHKILWFYQYWLNTTFSGILLLSLSMKLNGNQSAVSNNITLIESLATNLRLLETVIFTLSSKIDASKY